MTEEYCEYEERSLKLFNLKNREPKQLKKNGEDLGTLGSISDVLAYM